MNEPQVESAMKKVNFNELQLDALLADMETDTHMCNCGNGQNEEMCEDEDEYMEDTYFNPADSIFGSEVVNS